MFPQRRRNSLSKIMRVICGFTSCVLTLATLAIVPIASSNASTEETAKTSKSADSVKDAGSAEHTGAAEQGDKKKAENQPGSSAEKNAEPKTEQQQPGGKPEKKTSATTNTNTQNEASNDKKAKQSSKDNKAKDAAKSAKTENHENRSVTGNTENSAQFYNPAYPMDYPNVFAGNLSTSAKNKSGTPKSRKIRKNKNVRVGYLPAGTWFELIKTNPSDKEDAYDWANFEGEQCDASSDNTSGNNASSNNASGNNKQCKKTKAIPEGVSIPSKYGVITFRPSRWTKDGNYKVHVLVHYPDGTTSDEANAGNSKGGKSSPVYANVVVTRFDPHDSDLQLSIISKDKEDLKYGQSDNSDLVLLSGQEVKKTTFDASAHLGIGNINQRVICYKKDKNGNPVDGKYESGGINGLELKQDTNVTVWKHASYDQQKKCFDDPANGCKMADFLYDDYVYNEYVKTHPNFEPKSVNERTVGQFKGTVNKTGDFVCKVYALRNSVKDDGVQDEQDDALVKKFDQIAAEKHNKIDEIDSVLKQDALFKSGITWEAKTLNITVRRMSYYYQPYYGDGIDTLPGKTQASIVPLNQCGVGKNCSKKLARTRHLPDGTWFEIANYPKSTEELPDWASFIDDEDDSDQSNKPSEAGGKVGKDSSDGSGAVYGKITVRMSTWIKTGYYYVPVVAHYPDGSSSKDEDSSNEGKPIYLKVSVNNSPRINNDDLKLRVTTEKASADGESDSQADDYGDVDPDQGITMMRGMRFLNPYIDAWSLREVGKKISLKVLCTKVSKASKASKDGTANVSGSSGASVWSSNVDGLTAPTEDQIHKWDHIKTVAELKGCDKNPASCDAKRTLFRRDVEASDWDVYNPFYAVERTDSIIGGAPTETGDYQCVVYALKPTALKKYEDAVAAVGGESKAKNGDTLLNGITGIKKGKDWTMTAVKIHVVEPFKLPKTGFAGWNMILSVATTIFTSLMVLAFVLDQTQWGRAFMKNFVYRNSAQNVSEIAVQKGTEVSARKGNEIKERK
ncbi:Rib/alpha-like domain-containing protein [Gardnerella vaginalis]|uniref:Long Rib domain-containing protein n=1 Tax=Gardnerella vaginalis TaxID=2702 RepID=A0A2K1SUN6_GARVA|nr:Rib/alpha-like domain-containing protein [Gardnerella vaginalis]PNS43239.1 hypothetical protein BFS05_04145 [Gardnerella vaginalis]